MKKTVNDFSRIKELGIINAEQETGYNVRTFKNGISYEQIKNSLEQTELFDDDFNECDSGYCGL